MVMRCDWLQKFSLMNIRPVTLHDDARTIYFILHVRMALRVSMVHLL